MTVHDEHPEAAARVAAAVDREEEQEALRSRRRWLTFAIIALALYTARSFLGPVAWAAVLAVSLWPLYTRALARAPRRPGLIAAGFTLATGLLVMLPIALAATAAVQESQEAMGWIGHIQKTGLPTPPWLGSLPLVGARASAFWASHVGSPQATSQLLGGINAGAVLGYTSTIGGQAARGTMLFLITLLAMFALLVRGPKLAAECDAVALRGLGEFGRRFVDKLAAAVRGTVTGTVLVAVGEGLLIGVGYWVSGAPRPLLLTILTIFVALLPFGAWFAFGLATLILLIGGHVLAAALLFGYSVAVMLVGDNVIQPAIIGNTVRLPFLLALLGTFGGLETFGLVGLFVGPVIMVAVQLAWAQWREEPAAEGAG